MKPLILASTSPRRVELLAKLGYAFDVLSPKVEEWEETFAPPEALVLENARRKSLAVGKLHPGSLVVGADTVVTIDNRVLGKPADRAEAVAMLSRLAGRVHFVKTGICLVREAREIEAWVETSRVTFFPLDQAAIEDYLDRINPYDKAGGYAIQDEGHRIIENYEGDHDTIMGLPLVTLGGKLKNLLGVSLLS
jgi:septum formation protein